MSTCAGPGEDNAAAEDVSGGGARASVEAAAGDEAATGAATAADYPRSEDTS